MAKPVSFFTHSTDAVYGSGPATGQPTKVVIPSAAQGLIPGDDLIPEYINDILNLTGQYTDWVFAGSSAGAADAHIVETDASGNTAVQDLSAADVTTTGFVDVGTDLSVDNGYIRTGWSSSRTEFYGGAWPADFREWSTGGNGSSTILQSGRLPAMEMTSGPVSSNIHNVTHSPTDVFDVARAYVFEFVARITSAITTVRFEFGMHSVAVPLVAGGMVGCVVVFDTNAGDTNWTLAGSDSAVLTRNASSVAVVQNVWHKFRVAVAADGSAEMFIDGVSEATLAATEVGTNASSPIAYCRTDAAADRTVEIERIDMWQPPSA